jgi:hypothetical protein
MLSVNTTGNEPKKENMMLVDQFISFADHGAALTGKDAILVMGCGYALLCDFLVV